MRSPLFFVVTVALLVGVAWAEPAAAQFRNNGIQIHVGYLGLGSIWDRALNGGQIAEQNIEQGTDAAVDPGWNMADQPTVGVSYYRAIGYQTWWDNQVAIGAWTLVPLTTAFCVGPYSMIVEPARVSRLLALVQAMPAS